MPDTVEVIRGNMPVACFRDLKGRTESKTRESAFT